MTEHEVVIAGGGPTGMMLAAELTLAGVDVAVVERRPDHTLEGSRGGGVNARTIEVLDQRGVADRFLAEGKPLRVASFAGTPLDISSFPSRHPYSLALWQRDFERILAGWVDELGFPVYRRRAVTGLTQDETGVTVELSEGPPMRTAYLIGCDGGRSVVRRAAGIEFPGWDASVSSLLAETQLSEEPEWGVRYDDNGTQAVGPLDDGTRARMVLTQPYTGQGEPTLDDLREALIEVYGTDFGVHSPTWISRFTDATRQAATYRDRRVLLAGDAAHIHYPVGGQGLNLGVQDAVNLGWKLAQVVRGTSPDSLLDTYHLERHPVAARVLQTTMAQTVLTRSNPRLDALRDTVAGLMRMEEPGTHIAGMLSGLDIRYDLGDEEGAAHPLLGRRMPDLDLTTPDGPLRVYTLLHQARPALLNLDERGGIDIGHWAVQVQLVDATYARTWELPVIGVVRAPTAVLVRPDGHVAWVGEGATRSGLEEALTLWFGPPAAGSDRARNPVPEAGN